MESKTYSILVAEDDQEDKELVISAIKDSQIKCQVNLVSDGVELLHYLQSSKQKPDVILLDINMPKIDGLVALKQIKEDKELQNIPVYILSVSNSDEHRRKAKELGASKYYLKTPRYKELIDIIKEVCQGHPFLAYAHRIELKKDCLL